LPNLDFPSSKKSSEKKPKNQFYLEISYGKQEFRKNNKNLRSLFKVQKLKIEVKKLN